MLNSKTKRPTLEQSQPAPVVPSLQLLTPTVLAADIGAQEKLAKMKEVADLMWDEVLTGNTSQRMKKLLGLTGTDKDPFSEWTAVHDLLRASKHVKKQMFLGLVGEAAQLVAKKILEGHSLILGGTGTGKTAATITQILLQVGRGDGPSSLTPIFIFDLKPDGDRYLRAVAEKLVAERHAAGCSQQTLDFFSNSSIFESQTFDPMHSMQIFTTVKAKAQGLLSALIPTRVDQPDAVFFLNENRALLESVLQGTDNPVPNSFRQLLDLLDAKSRGKHGNREARGVHGALSDFENVPHVRVGVKPSSAKNDVDFGRVFDERRIVYVHLDSQNTPLASRSVGRLMLFSLLAEALKQTVTTGIEPEFYLFMDEFHELASYNIANLFTVMRSVGARAVMSFQSTGSFDSKSMTDVLLQNTQLQFLLSPDDDAVVKSFARIAGEHVVTMKSGSKGISLNNGASRGTTETSLIDESGKATVERIGISYGGSFGHSESYGSGWQEVLVSSLTPGMLADLDSLPMTALVRAKKQGKGSESKTEWHGVKLLQLLYPFTRSQAERMRHSPWPADTSPPELPPPPKLKIPKAIRSRKHKAKVPLPAALEASLQEIAMREAGKPRKQKKTKTP